MDPNIQFVEILPSFPVKGKLQLMKSELTTHLCNHERLLLQWSEDTAVLWNKTRSQHNASNHPWFQFVEHIWSQILSNKVANLDKAIKQLGSEENALEVEQEDEWETVSNNNFEE
jgi:hypothetical protein